MQDECIRNVSNFSKIQPFHIFDKKGFDPTITKMYIENGASPKLQALLEQIKELDKKDMEDSGKMFKHIIFTDMKSSKYGAKLIAGALASYGMNMSFSPKGRGFSMIDNETLLSTKNENFSILLSKNFYNRPMNAKFRKDVLEKFNSRPDNIHGELVRFLILDQGFKEGIDVYDVKYIHLFEPLVINADEKQAIGRGTRFCGQKGLEFHPSLGWQLHVFKYDTQIPLEKQSKYTEKLSDLYLQKLGIDMRKNVFASELENVTQYASVDRMLNKSIHEFKVQDGGTVRTSVPPKKIMNLKDMNKFIRHFSRFLYPKIKLENKCMSGGGANVISFTPSQDFVRHYFQKSSAYKGILLHHSVGTGKTCTAIATATTGFDDYNILWVTRHTLKNDIWKNMFNQVCHMGIREKIENGLSSSKVSMKSKSKLLSNKWMNPISYKQFSNMLLKKNKIYDEMVKRNGKEDPLRKTLLIVDEAHKLYAPGVAKSEKPNTDILEEMIQKSYDVSGNDSVRLLLMTATPYTEDGMEMIKLLNLLRSDKFPSDFDNFSEEYLNEHGKFSKTGVTKFQDKVSGYISYLNRSRDARNFAYPIVQNVMVDLSVEKEKTKETNKFDRMNKTLKDEIKEIKSLKKEQDQYNKMILKKCLQDNEANFKQLKQSTNQNQKDEMTKCNKLSTKERVKCRQNVKEVFAKKQIDIKESNEKRKEDCKQKVEDTVDLNKDLETKYQELDQTIKDKNNFKDKKNSISTKLAQTRLEILQNKLILKDINQKISEKTRQINKIQNNKEKLQAKKDLKNDVLYSQLKEITNNIANYKGRMTSLKAEKKVTNVNANPSKLYNISQEYALEKYCKI
jgi:hypothetical protein